MALVVIAVLTPKKGRIEDVLRASSGIPLLCMRCQAVSSTQLIRTEPRWSWSNAGVREPIWMLMLAAPHWNPKYLLL